MTWQQLCVYYVLGQAAMVIVLIVLGVVASIDLAHRHHRPRHRHYVLRSAHWARNDPSGLADLEELWRRPALYDQDDAEGRSWD